MVKRVDYKFRDLRFKSLMINIQFCIVAHHGAQVYTFIPLLWYVHYVLILSEGGWVLTTAVQLSDTTHTGRNAIGQNQSFDRRSFHKKYLWQEFLVTWTMVILYLLPEKQLAEKSFGKNDKTGENPVHVSCVWQFSGKRIKMAMVDVTKNSCQRYFLRNDRRSKDRNEHEVTSVF